MRKLIVILFLVATVVRAVEPSVRFDIQPRLLQIGESATATLQIRGVDNPGNPGFPQIDGFQVTSAGTETSFSFGGGNKDSAVTHKFSLTALKPGKYEIGPFSYSLNGKNYDLPALLVEVAEPAASTVPGAQPAIFARLEPSSTNLYVQQVFDLVLKLYVSQKVNLAGVNALQNLPSQGLVVHQPRELDTQRELVQGEIYVVRRYVAKAQAITAGQFDLAPSLRIEIVNQQRKRRGPFDDDFFGGFFNAVQTEPREIAIEPVSLVVKNLPEQGKPASFAGAIGRFTFDMTAKPTELTAGDPVTLAFRIAGRGNIESAPLPNLSFGEQFKVYEPKLINQNINKDASSGEKAFELVVMPRTPEANRIPEIDFCFFDPEKGAYETIRRGPVALTVHPAAKDKTSLIVESRGTPEETAAKAQMLGSDIVYLKTIPKHIRPQPAHAWYAATPVLAAQTLPVAALAAAFLLVRRRERLAGDVSRARRHMAPKAARAGLERARAATEARDFHDALWQGLSTYFGHRLNLEPGEVSSERVLNYCAAAGLKPELAENLRDLFARCERARFGGAPAIEESIRRELIERLEKILNACEALRI